jgi:hypothetical protein
MSHPDDLEGGLRAEQVSAIFNERAAIMDLVEAIADDAHPERREALLERYEEAAEIRSELGLTDHQLGSSEPIRLEAMAGDRPVKALLIPADPSRPVQEIEVSGRDDLRQHVGGLPEATQYDLDSIIYISDTGRIDGQAMNTRATDYIRRESEAARQGKMIGIDPSYGLYGTAVVVGADERGMRDVPDRLVTRFNGAEREQMSTVDKIREAIRDRNEDGMIRIPWLKDRSKNHESPSPNWTMGKVHGRTVYYRTQGEAVVWKDRGRWAMDYAVSPQSPTIYVDLGRTRSADQALNRADLTIMSAAVDLHQSYEDVRNVVNLANEVEDRTPAEQASLDRLQESIDQGPPPGALDPADDWLAVFEQETQEREQDKGRDDQDRGV